MLAQHRSASLWEILGATLVASVALVCLGTALVFTDRLRPGLVVGLIPFITVFGLAYALGASVMRAHSANGR